MYNLSYFKEPDQQKIFEFIQQHPFAFLTGSTSDGSQVATQVPVLIEERDGDWYLQGHIMRNTDHHKAFQANPNVLCLFTGPHAYVSASWYTNPSIGSTWNYMSVHCAGEMRMMSDEELIALMRKLTLHFEKGNEASPTFYDNLPDSFLNNMLPIISGFEIKVEKLDNVFKLSQNRDLESYDNIISKLEEEGGGSAEVAEEMRKRKDELFAEGKG